MDIKIYNIDAAVRAALDAVYVDEETGEIVGADHARAVCTESAQKIANTAKYIKSLQAQIDAMRAAEKDIAARRRTAERLASQLLDFIGIGMQALEVTKIADPEIAVKFAKNPPAVELYDEAQIPEGFIRTKVEKVVDKAAIKDAIKAGIEVPGARMTQTQRIAIK